jgi:integrase
MTATIEKPKQKRRGKGEGSIFKRGNRWAGVLTVGTDENGKQLRRWVFSDSRKDVQDQMTALRGQKLKGILTTTTRTTVADWLTHWIANVAPNARRRKKACRATTLEGYTKAAQRYINPHVGGRSLSKLKVTDIQFLHGELRRAGLATGTIRIVHAVLASALEDAVELGFLAVNVCHRAGRPRADEQEMQCLSSEQAAAFLEAAKTDRLCALHVLAITTGCRQGELLGLKRDDIDLTAGTLSVRRTLVYSKVSKLFVENPPKSKAGVRTIRLPAMAVEALHDHFRRMLVEGHAGSEYVFCAPRGGPLFGTNVRRGSLRPILKAAKLPTIRFHDLRHTSATLLLASGENPKVVQARMGHGHISVTYGYAHVLPGMDDAAAAKFDTLLVKKSAG